jgi:pimeloyl-ACP methyl ester carboxylesterase
MRIVAVMIALLSGLFAAGSAYAQAAPVRFAATCTVEGAPAGLRCGTIDVPEDRSRRRGRRLSLRFVVVPAGQAATGDPVFYIAGGPGESAVESLAPVLQTLRSVEPDREIVFLDQRGTGGSNRLSCPNGLGLLGALADEERLRQCFARLRERADLGFYSSADAVADLEDLRAALRYGRVNLVGVSYGVRVALLYMQRHPQNVRSAVLRSAYPLGFNIIAEGSAAADAALVQLLEDCERDPACRQAFPVLRDQLRALDGRLGSAPAVIDVGAPGAPVRMEVSRDLFHFLLLTMMQSSSSRQYVPLLIATAATQSFQPFAATLRQLRDGISELPVGMYLSVVCGEDYPRLHRPTSPRRSVFLITAAKLERACSLWPVKPATDRASGSRTSDVPALVISGALDPVTPAEAGARLAASRTRATHIVLPATAHGPMFPDCVRPLVAAFFETLAATSPGNACRALTLPPFALPSVAAPAPAATPDSATIPASAIEGTWDLQWPTSRGSSPGGYLVIRRKGSALEADLHGRGSLRASGTIAGSSFTLRGERMFVPYTLKGTVDGDRIEGVLKVMSVERSFVGERRKPSTDGATRPGRGN